MEEQTKKVNPNYFIPSLVIQCRWGYVSGMSLDRDPLGKSWTAWEFLLIPQEILEFVAWEIDFWADLLILLFP